MIVFRVIALIALLVIPTKVFAAGVEVAPKFEAPLQPPQLPTPLPTPQTVIVVPPIDPPPGGRVCHAECDHSIAGCSASEAGNNCPSHCMSGSCD